MSNPTLEDVAEVLGEFVDLSGVEVSEGAVLGEDIPLDSRDMLRVVARLEARYGAQFTPQDLFQVKTLGDLVVLTRRRSPAS